jgi:hypothetical protein
MKNLTSLAVSILFLYSCTATEFYQVCSTMPVNNTVDKGKIVFEDENCKVAYDLWTDHGNSGFFILNKSDTDITIDLTKSFFVINNYARSYYHDRTLESTPMTNYEHHERTIPPSAMIYLSEFEILDAMVKNCDLPVRPAKKEIKVLKFDEATSPAVFYNLITYSKNGESNRIETKFYVNEVTNIPADKMFRPKWEDDCGNKLSTPKKQFIHYAPDKFYLEYVFYIK